MIAMVLTGDESDIWAFLGSLKKACQCIVQVIRRSKGVWTVCVIHKNEEILVENIEELIQSENIPKTITLGYTRQEPL